MLLLAHALQTRFIQQLYSLEAKYDCVLWIRNCDYSKQLFVGPNYEKYWGRSCLSLYEDPDAWQSFLVGKEGSATNEQLRIRNTPINPKHTEFYCFKHVDGHTRWMQDRSFHIKDGKGGCIVIAGVALPVTEEQMQGDAQNKISDLIDKVVIEFSQILLSSLNESGVSLPSESKQAIQQENLKQLSRREIEILYYILCGQSMREIAESLDLSPRTVESYSTNIKNKLGCTSKSELIIYAIEHNFLNINISI